MGSSQRQNRPTKTRPNGNKALGKRTTGNRPKRGLTRRLCFIYSHPMAPKWADWPRPALRPQFTGVRSKGCLVPERPPRPMQSQARRGPESLYLYLAGRTYRAKSVSRLYKTCPTPQFPGVGSTDCQISLPLPHTPQKKSEPRKVQGVLDLSSRQVALTVLEDGRPGLQQSAEPDVVLGHDAVQHVVVAVRIGHGQLVELHQFLLQQTEPGHSSSSGPGSVTTHRILTREQSDKLRQASLPPPPPPRFFFLDVTVYL